MGTDPTRYATLVDLARARASSQADHPAFLFLDDGGAEAASLTFGELDTRARAIGAVLSEHRCLGERVLLLYPPGLDFVAAFAGCLYGGAIGVPVPPPDLQRLDATLPRLHAVADDTRASVILASDDVLEHRAALSQGSPALARARWLNIRSMGDDLAGAWKAPTVKRDEVAYLQYTSGSTGRPKGVMISHANVMHQCEFLAHTSKYSADSVGVTWVPLVHDLGLFIGLWEPLYQGYLSVLMSPASFIERPIRWLHAMTRYRGTHSGGPNFGFDLCLDDVAEEQRQGLDLSAWHSAHNGAERVRLETLRGFAAAYEPYGFRWEAFQACCGLAEATLRISGTPHLSGYVHCAFQADELERGRVVIAEGERAITLVGHGPLTPLKRLIIVDPVSKLQCDDDTIGEVWVQGPDVALGYWDDDAATAAKFCARLADDEGPFLRTGDLGFFHDGLLYLTGRLKEIIIIRGRNLYPPDIEASAEAAHALLRSGCSAAFSVDIEGEEALVILAEIERAGPDATLTPDETSAVVRGMRHAVAASHETQVHTIVLMARDALPRTPGGKIKRRACREAFLRGALEAIATSAIPRADAEAGEVDAAATASMSETERTLHDIWCRLLKRGRIGVDDDFFELGGDSLLSIRVVAAAAEAGLEIQPAQLSVHSTIATLAAALEASTTIVAEQGIVSGHVPVLPGQRVCLALPNPSYFGTIYRHYGAHDRIDRERLEQAVQALVLHHDALRLRVIDGDDPVIDETPRTPIVEQLDLSAVAPAERADAFRDALVQLYATCDIARGGLLRVLLVEHGDHNSLVTMAQHLVADGQSNAILSQDLVSTYEQISSGKSIALPPKTTSIRDYGLLLQKLGRDGALDDQKSYWLSQARATSHPLPTDEVLEQGGATPLFFQLLSPQQMHELRTNARARFSATFSELLIAGSAIAINRWAGGAPRMDIVDSGRTSTPEGVDLRRTMGWIAFHVPMLFDVADDVELSRAIDSVREQLAAVPQPPVGYHVLRWWSEDADLRRALTIPTPEIVFQYQGELSIPREEPRYDAARPHLLQRRPGPALPIMSAENQAQLAKLLLMMDSGDEGLSVRIFYNSRFFRAPTIESLRSLLLRTFGELVG